MSMEIFQQRFLRQTISQDSYQIVVCRYIRVYRQPRSQSQMSRCWAFYEQGKARKRLHAEYVNNQKVRHGSISSSLSSTPPNTSTSSKGLFEEGHRLPLPLLKQHSWRNPFCSSGRKTSQVDLRLRERPSLVPRSRDQRLWSKLHRDVDAFPCVLA